MSRGRNSLLAARYEAPRRARFHKRGWNSIGFPHISSLIRPSPGGVVLTGLRSNRSPFAAPPQASITGQDFSFRPFPHCLNSALCVVVLASARRRRVIKARSLYGKPQRAFLAEGGCAGSGPGACRAGGASAKAAALPASVS